MKPQEWFASRAGLREAFLTSHGWNDVKLDPVGEDSAFRRYFRLRASNGISVILMEAVPDGSAIATPGHSLLDYVRISAYLRSIVVAALQVYEYNDRDGYLLIEDFVVLSFKQAREQGIAGRDEAYELATDVLAWLRQHAHAGDIDLPDYYRSHVHTGRRRVIDWYVPAAREEANADGLVESYLAVWDGIERSLPPVPKGFLHVDYHF